jgi:pimeloyl-ACP methyl ester carboxylesterase
MRDPMKTTAAFLCACLAGLSLAFLALPAAAQPQFADHYADNGGVRIHYVTAGDPDAPLVVLIHGFPDFWYTWRHLMDELDGDYRLAAMDTRGYNLSDKPEGVAAYTHPNLMGDVAAVIAAEGRDSAIIIGHDWGASIAWQTAINRPELVDRLVIMSVPHPTNMAIQLRDDPVQQQSSGYARRFQQPGSEDTLSAEGLAGWVTDPEARALYIEAFERSSFASMMNYYRANYPASTGGEVTVPDLPLVKAPLLVLHGIEDTALRAPGHNNTWLRAEMDTTVMWMPGVSHWIEQDAGPLVNRTIHDWLNARPVSATEQR